MQAPDNLYQNKSLGIPTYLVFLVIVHAIAFVSFANTTVPQACKSFGGNECSCMTYKGLNGWIQWAHFASGILALVLLYVIVRYWISNSKRFYGGVIAWLLIALIPLWTVALYVTERQIYVSCEEWSSKGRYTEHLAKSIHEINLYLMIASVLLASLLLMLQLIYRKGRDTYKQISQETDYISKYQQLPKNQLEVEELFDRQAAFDTLRGGLSTKESTPWYF